MDYAQAEKLCRRNCAAKLAFLFLAAKVAGTKKGCRRDLATFFTLKKDVMFFSGGIGIKAFLLLFINVKNADMNFMLLIFIALQSWHFFRVPPNPNLPIFGAGVWTVVMQLFFEEKICCDSVLLLKFVV